MHSYDGFVERVSLARIVSCIVLLITMLPQAQAQGARSKQEVLVIGMRGDWTQSGKPIHVYDVIAVPVTVNGSEGTLTVLRETGPVTVQCEKTPCQKIIPPAPDHEGGSRLSGVQLRVEETTFQALLVQATTRVLEFFKTPHPGEKPKSYIVAVSRGLEGDLKEAVVGLNGMQLDLAPVFSDLSAAVYSVRLEPLTGPGKPIGPLRVGWAQGTPARISSAAIRPGLYEVTLVERSGEPTGSEAWILVSAPVDYPAAAAAYQQAVDATARWPDDVDPASVRGVLRAYLESLAAQAQAAKHP